MSQSLLSKRWFHKLVDLVAPHNCRKKLDVALVENNRASAEFLRNISRYEQHVRNETKNYQRSSKRLDL